jgi:hypothetical protein
MATFQSWLDPMGLIRKRERPNTLHARFGTPHECTGNRPVQLGWMQAFRGKLRTNRWQMWGDCFENFGILFYVFQAISPGG